MLFFVLCASVCLFLSLCVYVKVHLIPCLKNVFAFLRCMRAYRFGQACGVGRCITEQSLFNFGVKPNNFIAAIHKLFDVYFLSVPDASPLIFKES